MAKGKLIKVDRGDGYRFMVGELEFDSFRRMHPRAFKVGQPVTPPEPVAAPARRSGRRAATPEPEESGEGDEG